MIISELKEITDNYEIINLKKRHSEILKYTNTVGGFCNGRDRVRRYTNRFTPHPTH